MRYGSGLDLPLKYVLSALVDFAIVFLALVALLAAGLRGSTVSPLPVVAIATMLTVIIGVVSFTFGLYGPDSLGRGRRLGQRVAWASLLALLLGYSAVSLGNVIAAATSTDASLALVCLVALPGAVAVRMTLLPTLDRMLRKHRIVVVGTGERARKVADFVESQAHPGLEIAGFYATASDGPSAVAPARVLDAQCPLADLVRSLGVHEVVVAVEEQRGGALPMNALLSCRLAGVPVCPDTMYVERLRGRVPIAALKIGYLVFSDGFRQGPLRAAIKRGFDIVVSLALLAVVWPVLLLAVIAIRLDSPGAVVYRQARVTQGGRVFTLLKLRSMRADAERDGRPRWAGEGDARVTTVGRILRRCRIDELPQLLNVLVGDMSFVGPRPERPYFVQELQASVPYYALRHNVKAGLTGWAQVRFPYTASREGAAEKLEYDLFYVKNNSLFLDLIILAETVRVVLLGEGAR